MEELTECLKSVQEWMDGVKLKLNPEKTEFIIIGQKGHQRVACTKFPCSTPPKQYIPGQLNVAADKLSRLGQAIQTE